MRKVIKEVRAAAALGISASSNTALVNCYMAHTVLFHVGPPSFGGDAATLNTAQVQVSNDNNTWIALPSDLGPQGSVTGAALDMGGRTLIVRPVAPSQYITWRYMRLALTNNAAEFTLLRVIATVVFDEMGSLFNQEAGPAGVDLSALCSWSHLVSTKLIVGLTAQAQDIVKGIPLGASVTGTGIAANTRVTVQPGNGTLTVSIAHTGSSAVGGSIARFTA